MPRSKSSGPAEQPTIGKAELEILGFVADRHPVTVREVADHAAATRGLVRTTVLNVMARLVAKGYLTRRKVGGVYRYAPRVNKTDVLRGLVRDLVERVFGGSVSPFVAYLAEDAEVTDADLKQLKRLVADLEAREAKGRGGDRSGDRGG